MEHGRKPLSLDPGVSGITVKSTVLLIVTTDRLEDRKSSIYSSDFDRVDLSCPWTLLSRSNKSKVSKGPNGPVRSEGLLSS